MENLRLDDPYRRLLPLLEERRYDEVVGQARLLLENELPPGARVRLHNLLCWTFAEGLRKPSPEAVLHGQTASDLALADGDLCLAVQCHLNTALARYQQGDYDGAWRDLCRAEGWLADFPGLLPEGLPLVRLGKAEIHRMRGEWLTAEGLLRLALEDCGPGDDYFAADIHRRLALLRLDQGRPDAALTLLQGLMKDVPYGEHNPWWKNQVLLLSCLGHLAAGQRSQAARSLPALLALARELEDHPAQAQALALGAVLASPQEQARATDLARQALNVAVSSGRRDVIQRVSKLVSPWLNQEI